MHRVRKVLVGVVACLAVLAAACDPVSFDTAPDDWSFEGFQVYSHVPDDPVGIVYFFHGSGGSAAFATKVETVDTINELVARGYGWVATESTERTGDKRWEVADANPVTNPDLARLDRLHDELIATTDVAFDTPIFGVGMSNGARMVTLWGQTLANAGDPVAAVAPFMGRAAPLVDAIGGLTIPGFWVIAENDSVVPNAAIAVDQAQNAATGAASVLFTKGEEPLLDARFTRIPEIDETEADAIEAALLATGAWDAQGERVMSIDDTIAAVSGLSLPPSFGASAADVRSQIQAILALHQYVGIFKAALANFFDAQLP
ncbi:MAG: hypothetical protein AAF548_03605 [Actinomycetota bacterium]